MVHAAGSEYMPLSEAAAVLYRNSVGDSAGANAAQKSNDILNRVAHAIAKVAPIHVQADGSPPLQVTTGELLDCAFTHGAQVLITTNGLALRRLTIRRADLSEAAKVLRSAGVRFRSRPGAPGGAAREAALDLLAGGAPLDEVLIALVRAAQAVTEEGARAAIFIADLQRAKLRFAAAAGLSESYTKAVDDFPIGPTLPSCGQAAYTGEAVIVKDVAADPLWAPFLRLANEHGIRACWSFPLHSSDDELLGTFALYHDEPREPDDSQHNEIRYFANVARLAIERHKKAQLSP